MTSLAVVIPAFNVQDYLKLSLESICEQTIPFDEIIIVDDGSSDGTFMIAEGYVKKFSNWKLIRTNNQGQGYARNLGFLHSKSDFIYFFDSDDLLDKNFVKEFHIIIDRYPDIDLFLFSGRSFSEEKNNSFALPVYDRNYEAYTENTDLIIDLMLKCGTYTASPCLYISKRDIWVKKNLHYDAFYFEDESIYIKLLCFCKKIYVTRKIFFYRRVRLGSTMFSSITKKHVDGDCLNLKNIDSIYKYEVISNSFKKLLKHRAVHYANRYVINSFVLCEKVNFKLLFKLSLTLCSPYLIGRSLYSYINLRFKRLKTELDLK